MDIVREHINFQRGLDPKAAMGIGIEADIQQWLKDNYERYRYDVYGEDICVIARYAADDERLRFVEYLLHRDGKQYDKNHFQRILNKALKWTTYREDPEVCKLLIDAGANVDSVIDELKFNHDKPAEYFLKKINKK